MQVQRIPRAAGLELNESKWPNRSGKPRKIEAESLQVDLLCFFRNAAVDYRHQLGQGAQPLGTRHVGRAIAQVQSEVVLQAAVQRVFNRKIDDLRCRLALRYGSVERVLLSLDDLFCRR